MPEREVHRVNIIENLTGRVATVREKVLENENEKFSRSGKSQGNSFSVREI